MANSADKDRYHDFGLSPLTQKAFSKSALTKQTRLAPSSEEAPGNLSKAWIIRLLFGLAILVIGVFAAKYVADMRKEVASQPSTTSSVQSDIKTESLKPDTATGLTPSLGERATQSDSVAQKSALEAPSQEWATSATSTEVSAARDEAPTNSVEATIPETRKYYIIAGSYSTLTLAKENRRRLPYRTRILEKDGKFRLISDSLTSSRPPEYLIDSLKRVKPNLWLAKAQ